MSFHPVKISPLRWMAIAVIAMLLVSAGCQPRNVAPELTFDQTNVDVLDSEIKKFEW